jgi:hypothetical protein
MLCGKRANHPSVWIGIGILLLVLSYLFIEARHGNTHAIVPQTTPLHDQK